MSDGDLIKDPMAWNNVSFMRMLRDLQPHLIGG